MEPGTVIYLARVSTKTARSMSSLVDAEKSAALTALYDASTQCGTRPTPAQLQALLDGGAMLDVTIPEQP